MVKIARRQPVPPCMTCSHLEDWPDRYGCKPWKDKIPIGIMDGRESCRYYKKGTPQHF